MASFYFYKQCNNDLQFSITSLIWMNCFVLIFAKNFWLPLKVGKLRQTKVLWGLLNITNYVPISEQSFSNCSLREGLSSVLLYFKITTPNGIFAWVVLNLYILLVWYFRKEALFLIGGNFFTHFPFPWSIYNCI